MINLINYGGGNMGSISRCLQRLEIPFKEICSGDEMNRNNPVILPGVGSFGSVMNQLRKRNLDSAIRAGIFNDVPFLGICVGMQVLFENSAESPLVPGLKVLKGRVEKFQCKKVPQIGWNRLIPKQAGLQEGYAYFVNSYFAVPEDESITAYQSDYEGKFCAAVKFNNITAFQFHPEKSYLFGLGLIRRWADAL